MANPLTPKIKQMTEESLMERARRKERDEFLKGSGILTVLAKDTRLR
jgi:hypothetical protein